MSAFRFPKRKPWKIWTGCSRKSAWTTCPTRFAAKNPLWVKCSPKRGRNCSLCPVIPLTPVSVSQAGWTGSVLFVSIRITTPFLPLTTEEMYLAKPVSIYFEGQCIARHRRCLDRKQNIYKLEHYLPLLEKKGRAIFYARPVQDTLPAYFLNWLQEQNLSPPILYLQYRRDKKLNKEFH